MTSDGRDREAALALLRACATSRGFVASPAEPHYRALWARDALITGWGALAAGEVDLVATAAAGLRTLAACQAPGGQIPAVVWSERRWDWGDAGATDASALFALTACAHVLDTGDEALWDELRPAVDRSLAWLAAQDAANVGLVDSPEAADWMDSSLHRGGKVLYVNACYARALALRGRLEPDAPALPDGDATVRKLNLLFWPEPGGDPAALLDHGHGPGARPAAPRHPVLAAAYRMASRPDRTHYCSHVTYGHFVEACDVLGNAFAVLLGAAEARRAARVLDHLAGATEPYPSRCWLTAATAEDDPWGLWKRDVDALQDPRWRNPPHRYHNAGVWPFIGALHAAALAVCGRRGEALALCDRVAAANRLGAGFHEWLDGRSGDPAGTPQQAWNAGTYLLADALLAGSSSAVSPGSP
jgi:hypothetical protein